MSEAAENWDYDESEVTGEHPPLDPPAFARAAKRHFEIGIKILESLTPADFEPETDFDEQTLPVRGLRTRVRRGTELAVEHKVLTGTALVVTVAGILAARHALRVRKKSS